VQGYFFSTKRKQQTHQIAVSSRERGTGKEKRRRMVVVVVVVWQ